ncbi:cysteine desulfurase / selenocysteine lyase [Marinospirillum celere]|uniref:Probable cysteine desulfurase n=1 Tax=Marinospirillum celere TaxID=1122252 RepID=A0A1I1HCQ3_9GAMM|nr:cysteine desulfurase [Marinospirillum celere]SFC21485.1 cysteine desulfurase / selenocysteine lyase [Marinospirillum celere]
MSELAFDALQQPDFDLQALRAQFPILQRQVNGKPLVYLDNAATCQKPLAVIEAMDQYYRQTNANIHRGLHTLSQEATDAHEEARGKLQKFINAASHKEIIFTRGATEAINLVAQSWGRANLKAGDQVLVSMMEHHANIVPWQQLRDQLGIELKVIPILENGSLDLQAFEELMTEKVKLLAITQVSNALGTVNPITQLVRQAHDKGALVLVDGAQAVPHQAVDVQALDADFYVFSGHKMYGPTGIGVLYGKEKLLEAMPPWQGGGDMIDIVTFEKTTYAGLPHKFEAGTPAIAEAIGLGVAADWMLDLELGKLAAWEHALLDYATEQMQTELPGLRILGEAPGKAAVISFVLEGAHAQDLGLLTDQLGIAIRTGHHCAMPVLHHLGVDATARASFAAYNTLEEVDVFVAGLKRVREMLV